MAHAAGAELLVAGLGATLHGERAADALLVFEPLAGRMAEKWMLQRSTGIQILLILTFILR